MIIKKRQILFASLVLALAAAVFVNWYYTKPDVKASSGDVSNKTTATDIKDGVNLGDAQYVISSDVTLEDDAAQAQANEYFAEARLKRQKAHDEAAEALNKVIKNSESSSDESKKAAEVLEELTRSITLESDIENLITAKIGCKNLVILNDGNAEIVVENGSLDDVVAMQIKEITVKQSGCPVDKISIIEMQY